MRFAENVCALRFDRAARINKFYILDLKPESPSSSGVSIRASPCFVISWINPDKSLGRQTSKII